MMLIRLGLLLGCLTLFGNILFAQDDLEYPLPEFGSFDLELVEDIDLEELPVLPELTETAEKVYDQGVEAGNNPQIFAKVGDCMTATTEYFFGPYGVEADAYDLGEYEELQQVIDHFNIPARSEGFEENSFGNPGLATASGFNSASVLDSLWADPNWCEANESPLLCDYRLSNPVYSLIMFGTNDVMVFEADFFDFYMRQIVVETLNRNIVPVLYTIPSRPEFPEKTYLFNQVIVGIAQDYDLPLVNLWLAIQELPNEGVDELEPIHLSIPEDGDTGIFDEEHLTYGYTMRNLVSLQTLDILSSGLEDMEEDE